MSRSAALLFVVATAACSRADDETTLAAVWTATIRPDGMEEPVGLGVAGGLLVVADPKHRALFRVETERPFAGVLMDGLSRQVSLPMHLATAGDLLFVPDYLNDRVVVASVQGAVVRIFGEHGSAAGQFDAPAGVAVAPDGSCYVADFNNHRVVRFDATGRPAGTWGVKGHDAAGRFYYPTDVAIGPDALVYVADAYNHRIQVLTPDGKPIRTWGKKGKGAGEFDVAIGIGIDGTGHVYVADQFNHRIQVFSPEGAFLGSWGGHGDREGQFDRPSDVAFDDEGRVYVADYGNGRVQVFELNGRKNK